MEDIFGREIKIGDKILSHSEFNKKGLSECFVADIKRIELPSNEDKKLEYLVTVLDLEDLDRYENDPSSVYSISIKSQVLVTQSISGKLSWLKY